MLPQKLSDRLRLFQRLLPLAVMVVAALYQLGPARLVHDRYGDWAHYWLEVLFFGTVGPLFLWITMRIVRGWVEQKEQAEAEVYRLNSELQQRVEERTLELKKKADALAIANAQLQELDQVKSEFVSLVSHEFRAPLTNMRGALELMGDNCAVSNSACTRMVKIVNAEVARLGRLVDGVLNVSRIESGELHLTCEAVDMVRVADQVLSEFNARQVQHILRSPRGVSYPIVWADPDRLHQVIANLVDNAVKYSPQHSEIILSVDIKRREGVLSISDSGPGIPMEEQPRLFQKFSRLDSGDDKETYGYGLGLYLCRRLIEGMNGKIWVESQPGHGATFLFALPLAENQPLAGGLTHV